MNIELPNLSSEQREILEKVLPLILAIGVAWLAARGIKKMFWSAFGLFWAVRFGIGHWF
jgi:hypothetical protein